MMLVKGRDQGRQPAGGDPAGGGHGIQGPDVQASVQTFHQSDLGVTEPIQDDPAVGAQTQLNRSGTAAQWLHVVLEAGSAVHRVPPAMVSS